MKTGFILDFLIFLFCISTTKLQSTPRTRVDPINRFNTSIPCTYPFPSFCGLANRTFINSRLINGFNASDRQWPWLAYVFKYVNGIYIHLGTATIISNYNLLTSGSFLNNINISDLIVVYGDTQLKTTFTNFSLVEKIIQHPKVSVYNSNEITNNLVILKLTSPIIYTIYALPICLPSSANKFKDILNQEVYTAGW